MRFSLKLSLLVALLFTSTHAFSQSCGSFYSKEKIIPISSVVHNTNPMVFAGSFRLSEESAAAYSFNGNAENYGKVRITLPDGRSYVSSHLHYLLEDGKIGINILPTADQTTSFKTSAKTADGKDIVSGDLVDQALARDYGLTEPNAPVFAFMAFTTPHKSNNLDFGGISALVQHATGHMGAYFGESYSRHSPKNYVQQGTWHNSRYPINLSTIKMKGVPPAVLNRNIKISTEILNQLNGGVIFPTEPYTFDHYRLINLEEVLAYWRGWNDPTWERVPGQGPYINKLRNDKTFQCYCSEHVTLAVNVALNVPHNLEAYIKIWGNDVGPKLFANVVENFKSVSGEALPKIESFIPIWERHGIKSPTTHSEFGKSLAWAPLTLADMINGFLSFYVNLSKAGPLFSSLALLNFYGEVNKRIGIQQADFMKMAYPVLVKMWKYDATHRLSQVPDAQFAVAFENYVKVAVGSYTQAFAAMGPGGAELGNMVIPLLTRDLSASADWVSKNKSASALEAEGKYKVSVKHDIEEARKVRAALSIEEARAQGLKFVEHYSSPGVIALITNGIIPADPNITIRTIGTAFPAAEVIQP